MSKKIKIFLGTFLGITAIFMILGMVNRSITMTDRIHVQRPVKEVFEATIVPLEIKEWLPNLQEVKPVHGSMDAPGNQFMVRARIGRKLLSFLMDVEDLQVEEKVAVFMRLPHMDGRVTIQYHESGTGTEVVVQATIAGKGVFRRSLLIVLWPELKHRMVTSLESLKSYVESDHTGE